MTPEELETVGPLLDWMQTRYCIVCDKNVVFGVFQSCRGAYLQRGLMYSLGVQSETCPALTFLYNYSFKLPRGALYAREHRSLDYELFSNDAFCFGDSFWTRAVVQRIIFFGSLVSSPVIYLVPYCVRYMVLRDSRYRTEDVRSLTTGRR